MDQYSFEEHNFMQGLCNFNMYDCLDNQLWWIIGAYCILYIMTLFLPDLCFFQLFGLGHSKSIFKIVWILKFKKLCSEVSSRFYERSSRSSITPLYTKYCDIGQNIV